MLQRIISTVSKIAYFSAEFCCVTLKATKYDKSNEDVIVIILYYARNRTF